MANQVKARSVFECPGCGDEKLVAPQSVMAPYYCKDCRGKREMRYMGGRILESSGSRKDKSLNAKIRGREKAK